MAMNATRQRQLLQQAWAPAPPPPPPAPPPPPPPPPENVALRQAMEAHQHCTLQMMFCRDPAEAERWRVRAQVCADVVYRLRLHATGW